MNKKILNYIPALTWLVAVFFYVLAAVILFRNSPITLWIKDLIGLRLGAIVVLNIGAGLVYAAILLLMFIVPPSKSKLRISGFVLLMSVFLIVFSLVLNFLEFINYENYIFGNYGIYLPYLRKLGSFHIPILFFAGPILTSSTRWPPLVRLEEMVFGPRTKKDSRNHIEELKIWIIKLPMLLGYVLFLMIIFNHLLATPKWLLPNVSQLMANIALPIEDRYEVGMLGFHKEFEFLAEVTPPDAVIIHPKQSVAFPVSGNQVLIRYHLYPRTLVTEEKLGDYLSDSRYDEVVYEMIDIGMENREPVFYPRENVYAERVIYLDKEDNIIRLEKQVIDDDWWNDHGNLQIGVLTRKL